jgi:hypothetical protein
MNGNVILCHRLYIKSLVGICVFVGSSKTCLPHQRNDTGNKTLWNLDIMIITPQFSVQRKMHKYISYLQSSFSWQNYDSIFILQNVIYVTFKVICGKNCYTLWIVAWDFTDTNNLTTIKFQNFTINCTNYNLYTGTWNKGRKKMT